MITVISTGNTIRVNDYLFAVMVRGRVVVDIDLGMGEKMAKDAFDAFIKCRFHSIELLAYRMQEILNYHSDLFIEGSNIPVWWKGELNHSGIDCYVSRNFNIIYSDVVKARFDAQENVIYVYVNDIFKTKLNITNKAE